MKHAMLFLSALAFLLLPPVLASSEGFCEPASPSRVTGSAVTLAPLEGGLVAEGVPATNVVVLLRSSVLATDPLPFGEGLLCLPLAQLQRAGVGVATSGSVEFQTQPSPFRQHFQAQYRDCREEAPCRLWNLSAGLTLDATILPLASTTTPLASHEYLFPGFNCLDVPRDTSCTVCYRLDTVGPTSNLTETITDPAILDRFDDGPVWIDMQWDYWKNYEWTTFASEPCGPNEVDSCGSAWGEGSATFRFVTVDGASVTRVVQWKLNASQPTWTTAWAWGPVSTPGWLFRPARVKGVTGELERIEVTYNFEGYDEYGFVSPDEACLLDVHFWHRGHVLDLSIP